MMELDADVSATSDLASKIADASWVACSTSLAARALTRAANLGCVSAQVYSGYAHQDGIVQFAG